MARTNLSYRVANVCSLRLFRCCEELQPSLFLVELPLGTHDLILLHEYVDVCRWSITFERHVLCSKPLCSSGPSANLRQSPTASVTADVIRRLGLITGLALGVSSSAHAKELYVDQATGSDEWTYEENDAEHPWATLGRAAWGHPDFFVTWGEGGQPQPEQAAQAGDTVHVLPGTYMGPGPGSRLHATFMPYNSGTADAPIVFEAQGEVRLEHDCGGSCPEDPDERGPLIGATADRHYITYRGFILDERNATYHADTGLATCFGSTGIVFEANTILGQNGLALDNHNGIRFEGCVDSVARNNHIEGIVGVDADLHHNNAGIMLYANDGIVMENNEILDCGSGIYVKGAGNTNITIRFNLLHSNRKGVRTSHADPDQGLNLLYQNIIYDCFVGVGEGVAIETAEDSHHWRVVNNTVHNCPNSVVGRNGDPVTDILYRNNIFAEISGEGFSAGEASGWDGFDSDYNTYANTNAWSLTGAQYTTLESWQDALGGCPGDGHDCVSDVEDPMFIAPAELDFELADDSPARDAGIDVLDLSGDGQFDDPIHRGAIITGEEIIGPGAGASPPIPSDPEPGGMGTGGGTDGDTDGDGDGSTGGDEAGGTRGSDGETGGEPAGTGSGSSAGADDVGDGDGCACSSKGGGLPHGGPMLLSLLALLRRGRRRDHSVT